MIPSRPWEVPEVFLTRIQLNPARRGTRRLLSSAQVMHAAVESSFPEQQSGERGRRLWRLDKSNHLVWLYIQSPDRPDLSHVVEQAGWPTTSSWQTRSMDELLLSIRDGSTWGFRLTANPTRSGRPEGGGETRRFGHVTVAQQVEWLLRRSGANGFFIPVAESRGDHGDPMLEVTDREQVVFARATGSRSSRVTLSRATFTGTLKVVDSERLRSAIVRGIGPGKAYGCGLLTLAPVSS